MAPSIIGVENIGFVTIAPHKHIVFIFFFFVPVLLLSLVLRQLRLLRQVRAQTAVKKRGNNVGYEKAPLGLLYVVSHEFLRVVYCPVNHSCLYN